MAIPDKKQSISSESIRSGVPYSRDPKAPPIKDIRGVGHKSWGSRSFMSIKKERMGGAMPERKMTPGDIFHQREAKGRGHYTIRRAAWDSRREGPYKVAHYKGVKSEERAHFIKGGFGREKSKQDYGLFLTRKEVQDKVKALWAAARVRAKGGQLSQIDKWRLSEEERNIKSKYELERRGQYLGEHFKLKQGERYLKEIRNKSRTNSPNMSGSMRSPMPGSTRNPRRSFSPARSSSPVRISSPGSMSRIPRK